MNSILIGTGYFFFFFVIKTRNTKKAPDQFCPNIALCKEVYTVQSGENIPKPAGLNFIVCTQEGSTTPTDTGPTPILLNSSTLQDMVAACKVSV